MTDFDAAKMSREEMKEIIERLKKPVKKKTGKFEKETDLCAAFIASLSDEWQVYPESGGFDILLVRKEDGFQIGIEAKLKLNAKVICQAAEHAGKWYVTSASPDCRAVLVPDEASGELSGVCALIGITVIRQEYTVAEVMKRKKDSYSGCHHFRPELPRLHNDSWCNEHWHEFAPAYRLELPDYIPDVICGDAAPVMLTHWKIAAIKIVITLEKRGYVTRQDFKQYDISMSRWTQGRWIEKESDLRWTKGKNIPDLKSQHPKNYVEIEADYDVWSLPEKLMSKTK